MAVVLDLLVSILAGVSILFTCYFAWKAFAAYSKTSHETYSVGQQRARVSMQVNIVWSLVLLLVSLILLGVSGLSFGSAEADQPAVLATEVPVLVNTPETEATTAVLPTIPTTPTATPTLAPLSTIDLGTTPVPTAVSAPPTLTPIVQPTVTATTATTAPATAVVSSGVGVWLRDSPSTAGEQLEWLLEGTVMTLLAGRQQADEFEWQQVRTAAGVEGWVAVDFIVINE